jgi:hypothetical protein
LCHPKTGNDFWVFYMGQMCLIFDAIDACLTTQILDGSDGGLVFRASGEPMRGRGGYCIFAVSFIYFYIFFYSYIHNFTYIKYK